MVLRFLKRTRLVESLTDIDFLDSRRGALEELCLTPRMLRLPRLNQLSCSIEDIDPLSQGILSQSLSLQAALQKMEEKTPLELEKGLMILIRIAHEQLERGSILSRPEKNLIFSTLFDMGQKLSLEKLKPEPIETETSLLIDKITEKNPKLAVVALAIRLNLLLQNKCKDRLQRTAIETLRILEHCILSVSVNWSHYNAQCIADKLEAVLNEVEKSAHPQADEILVKLRLLLLSNVS